MLSTHFKNHKKLVELYNFIYHLQYVELEYTLSYFCTTYTGKDEILDDDTLSFLISDSLVVLHNRTKNLKNLKN